MTNVSVDPFVRLFVREHISRTTRGRRWLGPSLHGGVALFTSGFIDDAIVCTQSATWRHVKSIPLQRVTSPRRREHRRRAPRLRAAGGEACSALLTLQAPIVCGKCLCNGRLSVRPSASLPVDLQQQRRAAALMLSSSASRQQISIDSCWRRVPAILLYSSFIL